MEIKYKRKTIGLEAKKCNIFGKIIGLMFQSREKADILLFELDKGRKNSLHSFFVFFPFYVLWLDDRNNVLEARKVKPFELKIDSETDFCKIIEVPLNKKNTKILDFLDGRNI